MHFNCIISGLFFTQFSSSQWVNELSLTVRDREILLSPTGMLSDKHIDAACSLLGSQFPKIEGLQSSLKLQSHRGFYPINVSAKTKGLSF